MASQLKEIVTTEAKRPAVIADCVDLIDREVKSKRGLSGVAVKGAYGVVKAVKPGIIREAVDRLLDPFVDRLDPYYQSWRGEERGAFETYLASRKREVADALLGVTDERARKADNRTLKKAYEKLRPKAMDHVGDAVPGIAQIIQRHTTQ
ncbi:MAG: hypothetical protein AAF735_03180 [Myxococcota bacterium]